MRCIAIDDEPIALSIISRFCERKGGITLTSFADPHLGLKSIEETKPVLVFLDIEMNDVSGLAIAKSLPKDCHLIFTTAYANYALEGFELNAVDFLHKPFSYSRFERAVDKVQRIIEAKSLKQDSSRLDRKIVVKVEYKSVAITLSEIVYIESMDNYVKIHRTFGRSIISQISLKNILGMLPCDEFTRIHKSYIASLSKVSSFTKRQIGLINDTITIPVGRIYADHVEQVLQDFTSENTESTESI